MYHLTVQGSFTPIFVASYEGHTDVVDVLVKAGADVNQAMAKVLYNKLERLMLL